MLHNILIAWLFVPLLFNNFTVAQQMNCIEIRFLNIYSGNFYYAYIRVFSCFSILVSSGSLISSTHECVHILCMNTALSQSFSFTNLQSFINLFLGFNVIPSCVNYSIFKFRISNFFWGLLELSNSSFRFIFRVVSYACNSVTGTSSIAIIYQLLIFFKTDT